jgi:hypothetical protein
MFVEPLGGRRYVPASGQRAREVKPVVKEQYPDAEKVVLVMDNANLRFENTYTVSSLYEAFPAAAAFEAAQKLEIHYTPKHGSWLNITEIALSAMSSQCLDRRIDTLEKLQGELRVWQRERNQNQKTVKWQFTTEDARIKLHRLYPSR